MRKSFISFDKEGNQVFRNIVVIDDQADHIARNISFGWQMLFSLYFFGNENGVQNIPFNYFLEKKVSDALSQVDCILLDLYLKNEDFNKSELETTGSVILKKIKQEYPFIPIIITTASNKARKQISLKQLGCDAWWIKESIDEQLKPTQSFARCFQLLNLVSKLTRDEYRFLQKCLNLIRIGKQKILWWENHTWKDPKTGKEFKISIKKEQVWDQLEKGLIQLKTLFQNKIMGETYRGEETEILSYIGVILYLSTLFEIFHRIDLTKNFSSYQMTQRGDYFGNAIYRLRNKAAHSYSHKVVNYQFMKIFFKGMFCYLLLPPDSRFKRLHYRRPLPNLIDYVKYLPDYDKLFTDYFR